MMLRTQDFSAIRQNEENHSVLQHVRIQDDKDKEQDANAHSVQKKDNADGSDTQHDAREQGRNKYFDTRKKKKSNDLDDGGIVIAKNRGGFDLKI